MCLIPARWTPHLGTDSCGRGHDSRLEGLSCRESRSRRRRQSRRNMRRASAGGDPPCTFPACCLPATRTGLRIMSPQKNPDRVCVCRITRTAPQPRPETAKPTSHQNTPRSRCAPLSSDIPHLFKTPNTFAHIFTDACVHQPQQGRSGWAKLRPNAS